jgi:hypothetical protein
MLYLLNDEFDQLQPVPFTDFSQLGKLEIDLEDLLARHIEQLFEDSPLLPFFRQRPLQPECDIYALNEIGDIVLFELKRASVGSDALDQLFRYMQESGRWSYAEIARRYEVYGGKDELRAAHQAAFNLPEELPDDHFNRNQRLVLVGSAADTALIQAIDFWKRKGLPVEFIPYRVYDVGGRKYFEFFSKPHDVHVNPAGFKGVLFDTCRRYIDDAAIYMIQRQRVSAFGDRKTAVKVFKQGDYVFYSHSGLGLIAAGKIRSREVKADKYGEHDELYMDVELLTNAPSDIGALTPAMPFRQVKQTLGRGFWWAKVAKVPYLDREESERLLDELTEVLSASNPPPVLPTA